MALDGPQVDRAARPAARTEDIEPWPPAQLLRDSVARLRNDGEKVYCLSQWVPFDHSIE
jgi:hypothetical protein